MNTRLLLLLVSAVLVHAMPVAAQEKMNLRQHWEPGKVYKLESNMQMEMTMPALLPGADAGGTQTTNVIQQIDLTVSKEAGTDRKLVEAKFAAVKAMMNMGGQLMTYDSSDPAMSQPMLQQAFGTFLGKSVTMVFDKDDKFLDVQVPADFVPTPIGGSMGPDGKQIGGMMKEMVDFGLPENPAGVGEKFTLDKKIQLPGVGTLTAKLNGTVDSLTTHEGRKHVKLLIEGVMEMSDIPEAMKAIMSMEPGSKLSSETLYDLERKTVSRSVSTVEMKMNAMGKQMTTKQTTTSTLKSIENAPAK